MSEVELSNVVESCGPGRKRCPEAHRKILQASFDLLSERGWEGFTIEGVAARAGVGKATVYRWWPERGELALDSFLAMNCQEQCLPDTGCLLSDLVHQIQIVLLVLTPERAKVLRAVFMAIQESSDLRKEFESSWLPFRKSGFDVLIQRAVQRGQLPDGAESQSLFEMTFGPIFLNVMMGVEVNQEDAEKIAERALRGCDFVHYVEAK